MNLEDRREVSLWKSPSGPEPVLRVLSVNLEGKEQQVWILLVRTSWTASKSSTLRPRTLRRLEDFHFDGGEGHFSSPGGVKKWFQVTKTSASDSFLMNKQRL